MLTAFDPSTLLNASKLLDSFGSYAFVGVLLVVFAECGLLLGFFFPGDSLLFTVGLFISTRQLHVPLVLAVLLICVAAIAGNLTGYAIGWRAGPALFRRPDSRLFKQSYVDKTSRFFENYGPRAIVLARFVPVVRTFITAMAGVARMNFRTYAIASAVGGVLWGAGVTVLGYFLGKVDFVRGHIEVILLAIVLVSVLPILFELLRARLTARRAG